MSAPVPGRIGDRLAIRYAGPAGPTEAVGDILALDAVTLTLLPDGAGPVVVPRTEISAARAVPPRVVRPVSPIEDVELLAARGWPGAVQSRLGGWLLRAGSGASGRANSCLPVGDSGLPLDVAIERVAGWYAAAGLPPRFQVPEALGPRHPAFRRPLQGVVDALTAAGYAAARATLVLVGDVRRLPPRATPYPLRSTWTDAPGDDWWALDGADAPRREEAVAAPARYVLVREQGGRVLATGRLAPVQDWCGLSNLTVAAGARRRGHGRRALEAMLAEAAGRGAKFAYLQVSEDNEAALALYDSHGFTRHHRYAYWSRGAASWSRGAAT